MKKLPRPLSSILLLLVVLSSITLIVSAHPGRTDGNGGHTDHSTGEYHYHHGYSAHDHYDMDGDGKLDCPYDFKDNTGYSSGGTNIGAITQETKKPSLIDSVLSVLESLLISVATGASCAYILSWILVPLFGDSTGCLISHIIFWCAAIISFVWRICAII